MSQTRLTKHYAVRKRNVHDVEGIKPLANIVSKEVEVKNVLENVKKTIGSSKTQTKLEKSQKTYRSSVNDDKVKNKQATLKTFFTPEFGKPRNEAPSNASGTFTDSVPAISLKYVSTSHISTLTCSPKRNFADSVISESEVSSLTRSPKRNLPSPTDEGTPSKRKNLEAVASEIEEKTTEKPKESARRKLQLDSVSDKSETVVESPRKKMSAVTSQKNDVTDENSALIVEKPKESPRRKLQLDSVSDEPETVVKSPQERLSAVTSQNTNEKGVSIVEKAVRRKLKLDSLSVIDIQSPNTKLASASPRMNLLEIVHSPKRVQSVSKSKLNSPMKLLLDSLPGNSTSAKLVSSSPKKNLLRTPDKLDALIDSSRSTMVLSPKKGDLKKALRLFSQVTGTLKESPSSPRKNIIPSSPKSLEKTLPSKRVFACDRFSHLAQTDSLVLPKKYQMLNEVFRNMDSLVATLNNRKESVTFDKLKEGVQKIMKRNINEKHLGQIVTVFPSAYILSRQKSSCISKKNNSDYPLVITPNLETSEDDNTKTSAFQQMTPACLANRINEFKNNLLDIVKEHHKDFLKKINFAQIMPNNKINQWHPQFPVDTVPDVRVAQLPESPEMKIYTAKDVLNKFQGSNQNKIGKALQSVAAETHSSGVTLELKDMKDSKLEAAQKALKGIPLDFLEKIRAKESAKMLKTMTQTPQEKRKLIMLERVPKIAKILLHYFTSERKAALPVEAVVDKIIHSFSSLSTPDDIKEHLELIAEKFPDWLEFIQLRKGLYMKINKKTNINEMLEKAGMH